MPNSSRWLEDETDNPSYLHQGSKADLIQELKAWIDRRLQAYKDVMEFREECQNYHVGMLEAMNDPSQSHGSARALRIRQDFSVGIGQIYRTQAHSQALRSKAITN
jgi:hypothetical protein